VRDTIRIGLGSVRNVEFRTSRQTFLTHLGSLSRGYSHSECPNDLQHDSLGMSTPCDRVELTKYSQDGRIPGMSDWACLIAASATDSK
jgi:hypothetical protein